MKTIAAFAALLALLLVSASAVASLPRLEEFRKPLRWTAKTRGGQVEEWALHALSPEKEREWGMLGSPEEHGLQHQRGSA